MRWLGAISYSLYLYHPLTNNLPARINVLPLQIAFALCLAAGSYYIIETPFLRWKDSMNPKQVAAPEIGTDEAVQVSSDRPAPRTVTTVVGRSAPIFHKRYCRLKTHRSGLQGLLRARPQGRTVRRIAS